MREVYRFPFSYYPAGYNGPDDTNESDEELYCPACCKELEPEKRGGYCSPECEAA